MLTRFQSCFTTGLSSASFLELSSLRWPPALGILQTCNPDGGNNPAGSTWGSQACEICARTFGVRKSKLNPLPSSPLKTEDLDPTTSRRNLHHMRTVYLRLRWLADAGCVFLGHGLDNDFRMCNLTLPPAQVAKFDSVCERSGVERYFFC